MYKSGRPGAPPLRSVIRIIAADNYNGIFAFDSIMMRAGAGDAYVTIGKVDQKRAKIFQWRFGYNEMNKYKKPSSRVKRNIINTLFTSRIHIN